MGVRAQCGPVPSLLLEGAARSPTFPITEAFVFTFKFTLDPVPISQQWWEPEASLNHITFTL